MRRGLGMLGAAALLLGACSSTPQAPPPATPRPAPPVAAAPAPASARDQCGASELQALVGRPRTEIPVPLQPQLQRVACTTCPVTMDFNPRRLNFFFDARSGAIREIRCG